MQIDGTRPEQTPSSERHDPVLSELREGEIRGSLLRLTGSMYIGLLAVASVGAVDAFFIGKLGALELSVFGTCMPFILLLQAGVLGFGTGVATHVALFAGARQTVQASRLIAQSILMAVPFGAILWLMGLLLEHAAQTMLRSGPAAHALAHAYFGPSSIGLSVLVVPVVGTFALRALGRAAPSAQVMTLTALVNLVLCPTLIFGAGPIPAMGIAGAGWAAVAANVVAATYTLALLRPHLRNFMLGGFGDSLRRVVAVALPVTLAQSLAPLAGAMVIFAATKFGVAAVAALSVIARLDYVVVMMPLAISTATQPLVGQFWSAGKHGFARTTLQLARRGALVWGVALWLCFALAGKWIANAMCHDAAVAQIVAAALPWTSIAYVAASVTNTTGAALIAIGRAPQTFLISLGHTMVFLPATIFCFLMLSSDGLASLFYALPTAALLSTAFSYYMLVSSGLGVPAAASASGQTATTSIRR